MANHDPTAPERMEVAGVRASFLEYLHGCPICSCKSLTHYCRVPSLFNEGEFIQYERCRDCGVAFRNPRLPSTYREERYEDGEIPKGSLAFKPKNQIHYYYMGQLLRRHLASRSGSQLLDFGCGSGGFLVELKTAGFDVMGLELNKALAHHVQSVLEIPTYQGLITDPDFPDRKFDVIVSSQVFEHLVDPRSTLVELRDHLAPSGLILIEVPNLHHIKERLRRGAVMDDSHLFYFNRHSLPRLLRDQGFSVLRIQEGARPYRFLSNHATRLPVWLHDLGQRVASALQIKTGLSVLARLD